VREQDFSRIEKLLEKQTEQFQRYIGVVEEGFQHKLNLVVEGQQMLAERMDWMEGRRDGRIDLVEKRLSLVEANLAKKIDVVACDLSAHRKDTEVHGTNFEYAVRTHKNREGLRREINDPGEKVYDSCSFQMSVL
jgi:hypothetical protein